LGVTFPPPVNGEQWAKSRPGGSHLVADSTSHDSCLDHPHRGWPTACPELSRRAPRFSGCEPSARL